MDRVPDEEIMNVSVIPTREWLREKAEKEDMFESVTVGPDSGITQEQADETLRILSKSMKFIIQLDTNKLRKAAYILDCENSNDLQKTLVKELRELAHEADSLLTEIYKYAEEDDNDE